MTEHISCGLGFIVAISPSDLRYEVNPRKGTKQPPVLEHRFPIKGGIDRWRALQITANRKMLESLHHNLFAEAL